MVKDYEFWPEHTEKTFGIEQSWYSAQDWAFYEELWRAAQKKLLEYLVENIVVIPESYAFWGSLLKDFGVGENDETNIQSTKGKTSL